MVYQPVFHSGCKIKPSPEKKPSGRPLISRQSRHSGAAHLLYPFSADAVKKAGKKAAHITLPAQSPVYEKNSSPRRSPGSIA
jgi:hypothetical protein